MKTITFDFDNTIGMSYIDTSDDTPKPVFLGYNNQIVDEIKKNIAENNEVFIVTSRKQDLERYFPEQSIPYHLKQLGLDEYFLPNRLFYTDSKPKYPILLKLGTELHYDDDIEEHKDAWDSDYQVKQPLEGFDDTDEVGKTVIFDQLNNILVLQRSDSGHYWDLPGGHIKDTEVARGPNGIKDGTEREIYEETGLLVPFLKELLAYDFSHKGKMHHINLFVSQIDVKQPHIRLDLQDHVENIDYRWVSLAKLEGFLDICTVNLRKAHAELSIKDEILQEKEIIQLKWAQKHRKMKKRLIGLGKNKHFGGGKGHKRPKMSRSKSAPAGFGMMEEEKWPKEFFRERKMVKNVDKNEKSKKKVKIKVKITKNLDEKRKKRKKRRKNRKKTRNKGAYWPYFGGDYGHSGGDSGGDGGGGGE